MSWASRWVNARWSPRWRAPAGGICVRMSHARSPLICITRARSDMRVLNCSSASAIAGIYLGSGRGGGNSSTRIQPADDEVGERHEHEHDQREHDDDGGHLEGIRAAERLHGVRREATEPEDPVDRERRADDRADLERERADEGDERV